jgi:hypothetical protein
MVDFRDGGRTSPCAERQDCRAMIQHGRFRLLFALMAVHLALCGRPTQAQTISFVHDVDTASGVAADATGMYVVGLRSGDIILRKYDDRLLARPNPQPVAVAIVLDQRPLTILSTPPQPTRPESM